MAQMRSRREQVEAHKFITSRMNQALVLANPDSIERPLRRIGVSIFASVMVLALIFGGFAIATLFNKGNALPVEGNIITIKGTNSVYVYVTKDGKEGTKENPARLWQVTNYTSALLLAKPGSTGVPGVQDLKPSSLKDIPRGSFTIGIQGIPSQPPDPSELLQDKDWNTCSMPRKDGGTAEFQLTQLVVDDLPEPSLRLGDDHWILAKTATKEDSQAPLRYYLLWNGGKYEIGEDGETTQRIIGALGLVADDAMPLNENMLNTIPAVAPIMPEPRDEFDTNSQVMGVDSKPIEYGRPVQVGGDLYVLTKEADGDEFAKISPTLARVLESGFGGKQEVDPADASTIGTQGDYMAPGYPDADLHEQLWTSDNKRPAVCAVYDPQAQLEESTKLEITMYDAAPEELTLPAEGVEIDENGNIFSETENLAAQTVLPQGTAALADSRTDQGATISGFTFLISDQGIRHGIADEGTTDLTQNMLGYADVKPVSVPDTMINLIPKGPNLDPYEAKKQMTSNTEDVPVYETQPQEGEGEGG
jgi:type VII secretion protein EccB